MHIKRGLHSYCFLTHQIRITYFRQIWYIWKVTEYTCTLYNFWWECFKTDPVIYLLLFFNFSIFLEKFTSWHTCKSYYINGSRVHHARAFCIPKWRTESGVMEWSNCSCFVSFAISITIYRYIDMMTTMAFLIAIVAL